MRIFLKILVLVLVISCETKYGNNLNSIIVDHDNRLTIPMSSIFSDVEYIPLETNRNCLVDDWASVFLNDNYIITVDNKINVFDRNSGRFIKSLGQKGKGPDEYLRTIKKRSFNPANNSVFADAGENWLEFSINDDKPDKIVKPGQGTTEIGGVYGISLIDNFIQTDTDSYFAYMNNYNGISPIKAILFDNCGNILNTYPNFLTYTDNPRVIGILPGIYYEFNDNYFFKEPFNDSVFKIGPEKLEPVYKFDLGRYKQNYEDQETKSRSDYINIENIIETDNYIFFDYWTDHIFYCGFYSKKDKKSKILKNEDNLPGFVNDFDNLGSFRPLYKIKHNELAGILQASVICNQGPGSPGNNEHLQKLEGITLESNPVVMIAILRE